ncbi:winged helix-turn-helix transcriptional regulator [Carnobacterium pleistocenium]|uniref:winged helix-turn-helix transcriptional regulator n=1 Tax=Carnobacterium pleistocenium TaxID=181073 RepID=UPI000554E61E|nr:helix-turn-helix domain-containing protein [Carnobacterium pleistocenium]
MEDQVQNYCQISTSLEILVGKWKPVILLNLLSVDYLRFSELKRKIPDITQKMLTKQLRELEKEEIIYRKVYPEVPPKVEYGMTSYGRTLEPILNDMHEWGSRHQLRTKNK